MVDGIVCSNCKDIIKPIVKLYYKEITDYSIEQLCKIYNQKEEYNIYLAKMEKINKDYLEQKNEILNRISQMQKSVDYINQLIRNILRNYENDINVLNNRAEIIHERRANKERDSHLIGAECLDDCRNVKRNTELVKIGEDMIGKLKYQVELIDSFCSMDIFFVSTYEVLDEKINLGFVGKTNYEYSHIEDDGLSLILALYEDVLGINMKAAIENAKKNKKEILRFYQIFSDNLKKLYIEKRIWKDEYHYFNKLSERSKKILDDYEEYTDTLGKSEEYRREFNRMCKKALEEYEQDLSNKDKADIERKRLDEAYMNQLDKVKAKMPTYDEITNIEDTISIDIETYLSPEKFRETENKVEKLDENMIAEIDVDSKVDEIILQEDDSISISRELSLICAFCGNKIKLGKKFCSKCGKPILSNSEAAMLCPNCRSEIKNGKKFCSKCGTPINVKEED